MGEFAAPPAFGEPPDPMDDGLPLHAAASSAAAAMTVMTAATRTRRGQGGRGPGLRPGQLFISCLLAASTVTVGSWQQASRSAAAGASRARGGGGPSLEGYAGGARGGSGQGGLTGGGVGRGGYRGGGSRPTFWSRSPSWCVARGSG